MRGPSSVASQLALLLQTRGVVPARELQEALRVSQPTFSRAAQEIDRYGTLERIGSARRTRYGLRRSVRHLGERWPILRISESGHANIWAELIALHGGYRLTFSGASPDWMEAFPDGIVPGLPFFLQDVRPTGFLGGAIAREGSDRLGLPSDPNQWQEDDALTYLVMEGDDLAGDLVVGDPALQRWYRRDEHLDHAAIDEAARETAYPRLAAAAQRGEVVGSSAGGEQPKFTAVVQRRTGPVPVLVKFTAADPSPMRRRWADLLLCEHHAGHVLRRRDITCAVTRIMDAEGRRFLEIERFDRVGRAGRRGVLTLGATEDALVTETSKNWSVAAGALQHAGIVNGEDARRLRWLWCFGSLVANTDMHRANAGVWFSDSLPFRLAPTYDMLPMQFAPGALGVPSEREFSPTPPLPTVADVWSDAARAALEFWQAVGDDEQVSADFRRLAVRCRGIVEQRLSRFG